MKNNNECYISIIIPTRNSEGHLPVLLQSIKNQKYRHCDVIIADNNSTDGTKKIAKKYKAKFISIEGNPPQVAKQRNMGAKVAKGDYLYFMDHDMELSHGFLKHFSEKVQNSKYKQIGAWYIPEKIISNSRILSTVRNFEAMFIDDTVVSAARLIRRDIFDLTHGFDTSLSGGPADWDLNIQLNLKKTNFGIYDKAVYHHEEKLTVKSYIQKKTTYIKGEDVYKTKWRSNRQVYSDMVTKQYSLRYRIYGLFIERGKWKLLVKNLDKYFVFLLIKLSMAAFYDYRRRTNV